MTTYTSTHDNNFSQEEVDKFSALASRWWDTEGPQKTLHIINPVRLQYIAERCELNNAHVLDVGCGGGLLSEALAVEGAQVTAIDLSDELIRVAKMHQLETGLTIDYRIQSVESLAAQAPGSFDVITCMEMLEHVPDRPSIIRACAQLLRPGGKLFLATLNRTPAAYALAIVGAEYIARLLPKGTHDYKEFIKPNELANWLRQADLSLKDVTGMNYMPFCNQAKLTSRTDVNYLATAVKPK